METVAETITQAGIAQALRTSQSNVSHALVRLVDGGALRVERHHVRGRFQRVKVYLLTLEGEALVRHIREPSPE
jgi:DNA-binding MarR family transcriptional regulator